MEREKASAAQVAAILGDLRRARDESGQVSGAQLVETVIRFRDSSVADAIRQLAEAGCITWTSHGTGDLAVNDTPFSESA